MSEERAGAAAPSRRAIDLVAAYGVAQWNVVQASLMKLDAAQFAEAKTRQVAAYEALMAYIAGLEAQRRAPTAPAAPHQAPGA